MQVKVRGYGNDARKAGPRLRTLRQKGRVISWLCSKAKYMFSRVDQVNLNVHRHPISKRSAFAINTLPYVFLTFGDVDFFWRSSDLG